MLFRLRETDPLALFGYHFADLKQSGVDVPVSRCASVYRGKQYIALYTPEAGEYDFCDRGQKHFTDIFTDQEITFPLELPKGKLLFFRRGEK